MGILLWLILHIIKALDSNSMWGPIEVSDEGLEMIVTEGGTWLEYEKNKITI